MALKRFTFSNDLKAKELNYCDDFFSLKGEKITPSDSFSFNSYEALKGVNDFKTNNYSNLFLTKKQKMSNWLQTNALSHTDIKGIVSTLEWKDTNGKSWWLYFNDNYNVKDLTVDEIKCSLVDVKSKKLYGNHIFYIEFLNEIKCRISHTFADFSMVMTWDDVAGLFKFKRDDDYEFIYQLEGEKLKLFDKSGKVLTFEEPTDNEKSPLTFVEDSECVCYIYSNFLNVDFYEDSSWVGYDTSNGITSIDKNRSIQNLETQALIHHQYNKDGGFNFIPLKNNLTYKGNSVRGNNTNYSDDDYPDVDYRNYTSINSGLNQEKGKDAITLSFSFVDQEYEVNGGQTLSFTIDKSKDGELPTLFPYKEININDTKFIKNGAFASNVPFFSDKIKMMQDGSFIDDKTPNNATYLCTWLYKKDENSKPIWVDRYYYPDFISRENALSGDNNFEQSFDNYVNLIADNKINNVEQIRDKIKNETYFDKISDVIIKEGSTYHYQRISDRMVNQVLDKIEKTRISSMISKSNKELDLLQQFLFDGKEYGKIKYNQFNDTNVINMNFDIFLDRTKKMGIQLFGTDYKHGFNIQNRKDLAPFHYYATNEVIYLLNNKFETVHQFDFSTKYSDEKIQKMILGEVFDDVVIITNEYKTVNKITTVTNVFMNIFTYDLQLKQKLSLKDDIYSEIGNNLINANIFEKAILFENNIYLPFSNGILKVVMSPNSKDKNLLLSSGGREVGKWDKETHSVAFRLLRNDEYQKGFIGESDVKNIYIDEDGTIYALDFDKFTISSDGETIYGIVIDSKEISTDITGEWVEVEELYDEIGQTNTNKPTKKYKNTFYIVHQSLAKLYGGIEKSKYKEFVSENSIDMIQINKLGEMCLIRNFTNDGERKRMQVFDKTKQLIFEYDLSLYDTVHSLDSYTFIDEKQKEHVCFTAVMSSGVEMNRITYISDSASVTVSKMSIPTRNIDVITRTTTYIPRFDADGNAIVDGNGEMVFDYTVEESRQKKDVAGFPYGKKSSLFETVNSVRSISTLDNNALFFNLFVPSKFIYDNKATIKLPLDDVQTGWYNFNIYVDLESAIFELKINDEIYEVIKDGKHYKNSNGTLVVDDEIDMSWFKPYISANDTIFNTTYYVGVVGKKYGTILNNVLKNGAEDPYISKNTKIENVHLYTKKLNFHQYQAMRMRGTKINKLILTLPCGNRNCIDEMIRYFKYVATQSVSNNIKITIAGTGLQTEGQFNQLRKELMTTLENNKDCLIKIRDIEFIESEDDV